MFLLCEKKGDFNEVYRGIELEMDSLCVSSGALTDSFVSGVQNVPSYIANLRRGRGGSDDRAREYE
jgi:hypothetical protein